MKVIVGLGNPGKEYEQTRHNVGFIVLDNYLGNVKWKEDHKSLIHETMICDEKVLFVKPLTFMNNSGEAIREILSYYKVDTDNLLVIQDDIALEQEITKILSKERTFNREALASYAKDTKTKVWMSFWMLKKIIILMLLHIKIPY